MRDHLRPSQAATFARVTEFLASLDRDQKVERRETHGALVFLYPDRAIKIKKPVAFPYMDFSTLEKRRMAIERELEINRPAAPELYLEVAPIMEGKDGNLEFGTEGPVLEWALVMRRFDERNLFSNLAVDRRLDRNLLNLLAQKVAAYHAAAEIHRLPVATAPMERIIGELHAAFTGEGSSLKAAEAAELSAMQRQALKSLQGILFWRARQGFVRRCHGDLHLRNIVLWNSQPCLFDAIEFDEGIAIIDTLYDLAFLLMDLEFMGLKAEANFVVNRYLFHSDRERDPKALAILPLFLSCRAGIRAMVALDRRSQAPKSAMGELADEAQNYYDAATRYLKQNHPCLIAVGGFSGSGKTTLANALAPDIGIPLGALHLRSDLARKKLFNAAETEKLPPEAYEPAVTAAIYETLLTQAHAALEGGTSVIVDAVYARPEERHAIEEVCRELEVPFLGLWLQAPEEQLKSRVDARQRDASDATAEVVEAQLARGAGEPDWHRIDAKGKASQTLLNAFVLLKSCGPRQDHDRP